MAVVASSYEPMPSDEELVRKYRSSRDGQSMRTLFERYAHLVFGVCMKYLKNREESKDMVQRIFEKLMREMHKHEIDKFRPWLFVLSKNACLMELRKKKWNSETEPDELQAGADEENWHLIMEKEESLHRLEEAMQQLNDKQAVCLRMFYMEGHSYEAVSQLTGFSLKEVKSHIQNGKRNLKNLIEQRDEE